MTYLKNNKKITGIVYVLLLFSGCATSSYKILNEDKYSIEVEVTPDRVILECEKVETDDRGVVAGFMMHVMDELKTSFTLVQSNTLDAESCARRVKKIEKILKNSSKIYIVGIGDFSKPRQANSGQHIFPRFGSVEDNGRSVQFIAIKNEKNECFGAFSAEEKPCPPDPFPTKK
jgi:hypothetical protein